MRCLVFLLSMLPVWGLFVVNPVETVPICTNENTVLTPVPDNTTTITRIAWPITGPSFTGAVTVNAVPASGSPTILCMDCADPPCYPVTACDPSTLYWSVEFADLTAPPGRLILPDSPMLPPVLVTFYTPWAPSTSPSPRPSATPSATPSVAPSTAPASAHVTVACDVCDKSAVVGLSIVLAFLTSLCSGAVVYLVRRSRHIRCVYCGEKMVYAGLKAHLSGCKEHKKLFEPVVLDQVRVVPARAESHGEEGSEDAVARPETVRFVVAQ